MKHLTTLLLTLILLTPTLTLITVPTTATTLPTSFTWQNINGTDYTTPIKDQSPAPTCEAYALIACLETKIRYTLHATTTPDLSEAHLYFYAGGTIQSGYVNLADAANYLMTTGVPDEGCFPDPHRPADFPYQSLDGWQNRTTKITGWGWVPHDIDSIKQALITHGPLAVCIHFPQDFFYYKHGVYTPGAGQNVGGHVVALVGYDDTQACWIVKNSWGTSWGEAGWFKLSYTANIISTWYGPGSGIMYLGDVYGNLVPHVPTIQLTTPQNYKTYLLGHPIKTLDRKLPIQKGAARFIGKATIQVTAQNTTSVSFYVDGILKATDTEVPFSWQLQATRGLHTLEVIASDDNNLSKDTIDFWTATTLP
jgi:hypothetical protein